MAIPQDLQKWWTELWDSESNPYRDIPFQCTSRDLLLNGHLLLDNDTLKGTFDFKNPDRYLKIIHKDIQSTLKYLWPYDAPEDTLCNIVKVGMEYNYSDETMNFVMKMNLDIPSLPLTATCVTPDDMGRGFTKKR